MGKLCKSVNWGRSLVSRVHTHVSVVALNKDLQANRYVRKLHVVLIAAHALGRGYLGRDPAGIGLSHYSPIIFCRFKPFDSCCSLTSHPLQPQACLTAQRTKPPPLGGKSTPYASPVQGTGLVAAPAPPTRKSTVSMPFPDTQPK